MPDSDFNPRFSRFGTAPESPPDPKDYQIRSFLSARASGLSASDLPDEVGMVNLELHRQYVGITDQGYEGSCTGHGMRNTRMVNELRLRTPASRRRVPEFGPRGIYTLGKRIGGYPNEEGAYLRDVLKAANTYGLPREKDWPYVAHTTPDGRSQDIGEPISRWLQYARPWGIGAYSQVTTLEEILLVLHTVGPLFIAMNVTESFMQPAADGNIQANPTGEDLGGHCIALLAAKKSTRRFKIANSWGKGWGEHGYANLDFDHFLTRTSHEAWAVHDKV